MLNWVSLIMYHEIITGINYLQTSSTILKRCQSLYPHSDTCTLLRYLIFEKLHTDRPIVLTLHWDEFVRRTYTYLMIFQLKVSAGASYVVTAITHSFGMSSNTSKETIMHASKWQFKTETSIVHIGPLKTYSTFAIIY